MKRAVVSVALGLALLFMPAAMTSVIAAPAPAAQVDGRSDLIASGNAVANLDVERLTSDRAYAEETLRHLDRLAPTVATDPRRMMALDSLRVAALATLERRDEVRVVVDRMLARRSRDPRDYSGPLLAARRIDDRDREVAIVEAASQNVPGVGWAHLRAALELNWIAALLFEIRDDYELRLRLAESLFRIGWQGDDVEWSDYLRSILVDGQLAHGNRSGAIEVASSISTTGTIMMMIVQRKYDEVLAPGQDRVELLRRAIDEEGRRSAERLAAMPQDHRRVLDRVRHLRSLGRDAEALALLQPYTLDVSVTASETEWGAWLVAEAAFSLFALDRQDEALALMRRLVALPIADNNALFGASANYAGLLWEAGRHAEALDHALRLERENREIVTDYWMMWIAASAACSMSRLDRGAEAASRVEQLRAHRDINPGALTLAYLCVGDVDAAADWIVERLRSDDPGPVMVSLQEYALSRDDDLTNDSDLRSVMIALRNRPEVRAELDRVGRRLSLPLARSDWGEY